MGLFQKCTANSRHEPLVILIVVSSKQIAKLLQTQYDLVKSGMFYDHRVLHAQKHLAWYFLAILKTPDRIQNTTVF